MRSETSPTARALLSLELLQNQPGVTAERLAERLAVTPRAARRYVAILREAGIPIASTSGPGGGYRIGRGLRLPPLMFTPAEALGLVMAVLDGHHTPGDPTDQVGRALGKILRALPESVAAQAEAVRRSTAPVPDRGAARPDPETTVALVQAGAERCCVRIAYRSEAGTELVAEVEPWAVVVRHSRWYLYCRTMATQAMRAYRIDRVQGVQPLPTTFERPADLDPARALEDHLASGWPYEVEVIIHAPVESVRGCVPRSLGRLDEIDPQTTRLVGSTENPWWYAEQLASIPADYHIVGPPELRRTARALGQRLLAAGREPEDA